MVTRTIIGQAEGILMERLMITADQAFGVLSRLSQQSNVKLRDLARNLVETGEIPRI
jgi:AmiR/NasT family two-component response regulator